MAPPPGSEGDSLARVGDHYLCQWPEDLYIPPDALEVFLETFEGPLDLLLYLIRRQNLDILDIPIAEVTRQYIEYVDLMQELRLELAAEYLVMAAMLAEIKSRMLLPRPALAAAEEEVEDPRAELVRRLQEYERFKRAAAELDQLPRWGRDFFVATVDAPACQPATPVPEVGVADLLAALRGVLHRARFHEHHRVSREAISIRQRMSDMLERLGHGRYVGLEELLTAHEGRSGVVVTFLALLELVRESLVELTQAELFAPIYVRAR
ncbi:segregation/condensation protein A [Halorhodospira abdelmalekii]|uniref:segregation and condensation protein A n=1 Tax=Halorhodospira abdelmalekii TaxID=421629 RepID=UPI0019073EB8|nr:ScpA family protein [Halorhodospira abdelmalekii]MBK1734541.1 segregation/condensation protein A [Halorhodospira abdelmalekii]